MPSTILLKRSSTASSVPAAASLQSGELAVNLADQKLYSKTAGGTVVQVGFGNLTSAMVTTALGFTPYNSTNPNGYITASGSITGSSGSCTGNAATATRWATGRTIALTGDVTGTSAAFDGSAPLSFAATLANSGVTAGTYAKVTVDAKGRVTTGASLASADITGALGYTPANKAGESFTGSISVTGTITATGDITAYSDASLKADVATISNAPVLAAIAGKATRPAAIAPPWLYPLQWSYSSTLRALARERQRASLGQEAPFWLIGRTDGRLTLQDPSTGQRIDLESFGPSNAAVFASLRLAGPTAP